MCAWRWVGRRRCTCFGAWHSDGLGGWGVKLCRKASITTLLLCMPLPVWYALPVCSSVCNLTSPLNLFQEFFFCSLPSPLLRSALLPMIFCFSIQKLWLLLIGLFRDIQEVIAPQSIAQCPAKVLSCNMIERLSNCSVEIGNAINMINYRQFQWCS
jgi:hypothetical protein